jgi:hypothetical protein
VDSLASIVMISMGSKFPLVHRCLQIKKSNDLNDL